MLNLKKYVNSILADGSNFIRIGGQERGIDMSDLGYFGPSSVSWRVHGDLCQLSGGLGALFSQILNPAVAAGVSDWSNYKVNPWGRFFNTSNFVLSTTYGSKKEYWKSINLVKRVHGNVKGFGASGAHYDANDPNLLLWVHCCNISSFLRAYQTYGIKKLTEIEKDTYISEMVRVAVDLGVKKEKVPKTCLELNNYLEDSAPNLGLTQQNRNIYHSLIRLPLPENAGQNTSQLNSIYKISSRIVLRLLYWVLLAGTLANIPPEQKKVLGLPRENEVPKYLIKFYAKMRLKIKSVIVVVCNKALKMARLKIGPSKTCIQAYTLAEQYNPLFPPNYPNWPVGKE